MIRIIRKKSCDRNGGLQFNAAALRGHVTLVFTSGLKATCIIATLHTVHVITTQEEQNLTN